MTETLAALLLLVVIPAGAILGCLAWDHLVVGRRSRR